MRNMRQIETQRLPLQQNYANDELIGKYVKVQSKASHTYRGKFGKIIGFSESKDYVCIYFDETRTTARFSREVLEILNP